MVEEVLVTPQAAATSRPVIRKIGGLDLKDALTMGYADFSAEPSHMIFLCLIYPIAGVVIARMAMRSDLCRSSFRSLLASR